MTTHEIEQAMQSRGCVLIEDGGDFALVYPFGYEGRKRSHELLAKDRPGALVEAWNWLHPEKRVADRIEIIQRIVSADYGLSMEELCGSGRPEPTATARRIAMALAATLTPASTYLIGAAFGGRVHGTAINAKATIEAECSVNAELGARVGSLRAQCLAAFEKARV